MRHKRHSNKQKPEALVRCIPVPGATEAWQVSTLPSDLRSVLWVCPEAAVSSSCCAVGAFVTPKTCQCPGG